MNNEKNTNEVVQYARTEWRDTLGFFFFLIRSNPLRSGKCTHNYKKRKGKKLYTQHSKLTLNK